MSVWPDTISTSPLLTGSEGALISISINVDARDLESLLDALAQVDFPINPQIYHDAAMVYFYDGGLQRTESTTLVEFPAYAGQLERVRQTLQAYGFSPDIISATPMLDELHGDDRPEPAPAGADYSARLRRKVSGIARSTALH